MRKLRALLVRLGGLFGTARLEREWDAEFESHLQLHIDDNMRSGMSAEAARREALVKFGGIESAKESLRDRATFAPLETIWQDLKYGLRQLWSNPGFASIAILTLALGIGVNTSIFSLLNALMLRPLAVPHSSGLLGVYRGDSRSCSYPDFVDFGTCHFVFGPRGRCEQRKRTGPWRQ
jgi:hypothetical protein